MLDKPAKKIFDENTTRDVTISLENGVLTLALDGGSVVETPLEGGLGDTGNHDLVFGNPWDNKNFDGELSNFSITKTAALGEAEILNDVIETSFSMQDILAEFGYQTTDSQTEPAVEDAHILEADGLVSLHQSTDYQYDIDGMISQDPDGLVKTQPSIDRLEQDDSISTLPILDT